MFFWVTRRIRGYQLDSVRICCFVGPDKQHRHYMGSFTGSWLPSKGTVGIIKNCGRYEVPCLFMKSPVVPNCVPSLLFGVRQAPNSPPISATTHSLLLPSSRANLYFVSHRKAPFQVLRNLKSLRNSSGLQGSQHFQTTLTLDSKISDPFSGRNYQCETTTAMLTLQGAGNQADVKLCGLNCLRIAFCRLLGF